MAVWHSDPMEVLYEDNHLLAVSKAPGEIVQGDRTGDEPLVETCKAYIKEKYSKPGAVFLGVAHRLDRPVSGVVLFARTSKALTRLNDAFRRRDDLEKVYLALVEGHPDRPAATLTHHLLRNRDQNKSYPVREGTKEAKEAKEAVLEYRVVAQPTEGQTLLEIHLHTGRHHQIRAQLAAIGCPIVGDVKYGASHPLPDASIALHARSLSLTHPVRREPITFIAPLPSTPVWDPVRDL